MINAFGIFFNLVAGILISIQVSPVKVKAYDIVMVMHLASTIPPLVSCAYLGDAFRRFNKCSEQDQVIKKQQACALSFVFLAYILSYYLNSITSIVNGDSVS